MTKPPCRRPNCTRKAWSGPDCAQHHRQLVALGQAGYVPAEPVLAHMRALMKLGWSYWSIAQACGVAHSTTIAISKRRQKHVRTFTGKAILAIPLEPVGSLKSVPALGTRRRLEALAWMGWPTTLIGERLGLARTTLTTCVWRGHLSMGLALKVAAIYEELSDIKGPSTRVATTARTRRYSPPAAWDDPDTDAEPKITRRQPDADETHVEMACAGLLEWKKLNTAEKRLSVAELTSRHWNDHQIAERLSVGVAAVTACRLRAGIQSGVESTRPQPSTAVPPVQPDAGDVVAVQLACEGRKAYRSLHVRQRREAVRVLAARGMTDPQIAERLQASVAAVCKARRRNNIPAGVNVKKAERVKVLKRLGIYPVADIFEEAA